MRTTSEVFSCRTRTTYCSSLCALYIRYLPAILHESEKVHFPVHLNEHRCGNWVELVNFKITVKRLLLMTVRRVAEAYYASLSLIWDIETMKWAPYISFLMSTYKDFTCKKQDAYIFTFMNRRILAFACARTFYLFFIILSLHENKKRYI